MRAIPLILALCTAAPALAEGSRVAPVTDATAKAECSACHVAFPAGFLPAASWKAIMGNLSNHFGEDASLSPEATKQIETYLVAHAADAGGRAWRGLDPANPPLRITDLSWFKRQHSREVSSQAMSRAGSMANCAACHSGAAQGYFGDD